MTWEVCPTCQGAGQVSKPTIREKIARHLVFAAAHAGQAVGLALDPAEAHALGVELGILDESTPPPGPSGYTPPVAAAVSAAAEPATVAEAEPEAPHPLTYIAPLEAPADPAPADPEPAQAAPELPEAPSGPSGSGTADLAAFRAAAGYPDPPPPPYVPPPVTEAPQQWAPIEGPPPSTPEPPPPVSLTGPPGGR